MQEVDAADGLEERKLGAVTVLFGQNGGKYPDGNALLVEGSGETVLIDPALGCLSRRKRLSRVDRVLNTHCHEDHIAGNHLFPDRPWHIHELDAVGLRSLDHMMKIYGYPEPMLSQFREVVRERFHYAPRPEVGKFRDGDVFDLGGARIRVIHAPGHTRGHSVFYIEPDEILCLGDIELTSFGPYYGDAWSDLEDFERSLALVRGIEARYYATFHHIGVLERDAFLLRLGRFEAKIVERETRLLEFLREPRSLDEVSAHRFVYRPGDLVPIAEAVERRSMAQHIARLLRDDRVCEVEEGRYLAVRGA